MIKIPRAKRLLMEIRSTAPYSISTRLNGMKLNLKKSKGKNYVWDDFEYDDGEYHLNLKDKIMNIFNIPFKDLDLKGMDQDVRVYEITTMPRMNRIIIEFNDFVRIKEIMNFIETFIEYEPSSKDIVKYETPSREETVEKTPDILLKKPLGDYFNVDFSNPLRKFYAYEYEKIRVELSLRDDGPYIRLLSMGGFINLGALVKSRFIGKIKKKKKAKRLISVMAYLKTSNLKIIRNLILKALGITLE